MWLRHVSRTLNCTAANHICIFTHIANWWAWELVPSEVGGGPVQIPGTAVRFYGNPVSGNQHRHTEETSVEKLTRHNTYHEPLPMRGGKGWVLNWQKKVRKAVIHKLNRASKLQIQWPKQWSIQGSDPQRSAQKTTKIVAPGAHMQAHGDTSSCGHPTDHRDHRTH